MDTIAKRANKLRKRILRNRKYAKELRRCGCHDDAKKLEECNIDLDREVEVLLGVRQKHFIGYR